MMNGLKKKSRENNFMELSEIDNTTHKEAHTLLPLWNTLKPDRRGTLHSKYLHLKKISEKKIQIKC